MVHVWQLPFKRGPYLSCIGLDSESDLNSDLSEMGDLFGTTLDRVLNVDNEIATDENEYASSSDENSNNEGGTISNQSEEEGSKGDMTTFSMMSLKDDIEKGKAAKKQTSKLQEEGRSGF